jgi:protein-L-isoaspartate(D-aspartate) O-methyltransferase
MTLCAARCGIAAGAKLWHIRPKPLNRSVAHMADFATRRVMMVDTQVRPSDVTKFPIIQAMLTVPREEFVPASLREAAYVGENLDLGDGRVLLEPRTFAKMLDALDITGSDMVLDIGCANGYSSAVIAEMAEAVIALEEDSAMAREAADQLSAQNADNAIVEEGPLVGGAPEHAPFDVILVQGGIEILPGTLATQLKEGGRVCALFMDGALGEVRLGYKVDGQITWRRAFNASAPVMPGFERETAFSL